MSQSLIYAVILNTNRRDDTIACLLSLHQNTYKYLKIVVLDNNSTDCSVEAIRSVFPDVQIVCLTENLGYAGNNNIGIELAIENGADWVLVLNEDTILDSACVAELVKAGESDPMIGMVGPMVYHNDEPNVIQSAGGVLGKRWQSQHLGQNELDEGQFQAPHRVEWVSGCAIMVRKDVIEQVGLLDARFFIYWEETEWCIRASRAGWMILHVPQAKIWHKGVQRDYQPKPSFTYYATRNHLLTLKKHRVPLVVKIFVWMQILRTLVSWSVRRKWRHKLEHRNAMWMGALDYLRHRWGPMSS